MYTSFVLFALAGVFANIPTSGEAMLFRDYSLARRQSASVNKPLAVFIGNGISGWENVSQEGKLDTDVHQLLSAKYVCLYVDINQLHGRELANAFEVLNGPALVISNRDGQVQAFRHEGSLSNAELGSYLRRFSSDEHVVRFTETRVVETRSFYHHAEPIGIVQPTLQFSIPVTQPAPSFPRMFQTQSVFRSGGC